MKKLISALFLIFLVSGVYSQTPVYSGADTVISANLGDKFDIKLYSNQSTGYSWNVENNFGGLVFIIGKDYITPEITKAGSGGDEVWHFEAVGEGEAKLIFFYSRSLDRKESDNLLTFSININKP
jgi:predicted secreted protein